MNMRRSQCFLLLCVRAPPPALCFVSLIVLPTLALSSPTQTPVCVAFLARHSEIRAARSLEMFRGLLLPFPALPRMLTFHFLYGRRAPDSRCRIVTGVSSYILLRELISTLLSGAERDSPWPINSTMAGRPRRLAV